MAAAHHARLVELAQMVHLRDKRLKAALYGSWSTAADAESGRPRAAAASGAMGLMSAMRRGRTSWRRAPRQRGDHADQYGTLTPSVRRQARIPDPAGSERHRILPSFDPSAPRMNAHHEMLPSEMRLRTKSSDAPRPITGECP